jgi:hypothetical protein
MDRTKPKETMPRWSLYDHTLVILALASALTVPLVFVAYLLFF